MTTISRKRPVGLRFLPAILIMLIVTALGGAAMAAVPAGTGGISGVVYFDANGNGVRDGGEAGVAGATVTVVDVATEGGVYQQAVVTVGDGAYAFGGLDAAARLELRQQTVKHVVEVVDGYLLATFLLIFAFGMYELFISDIDAAKGEKAASKILVIESLDDLKSRLANVILMILVVRVFEKALEVPTGTPIDLLLLAACLVAIGLALWFAHLGQKHS